MARLLFKFYKSYFDVANELTDKDRLAFYDAIMQRQFYGIEPDLKGIVKLAYISQKHNIDAQIKGWEDKTKEKLTDPMLGGIIGGKDAPSIQVKEKEEVKEELKEEYKAPPFSFYNSLIDLGAKKELVSDWLKVRKNKNASNTKTAFDNLKIEFEKSGKPINEILEKCIVESWSGFKSSWNWNREFNTVKNEQPKTFNKNR
jgi:hypothetical protein